jgi:O-antigen/teichoic acid export membrane protein
VIPAAGPTPAGQEAAFRRILTSSGWSAGAEVVIAACGLVQSVLMVQMLGVEGFGVWGVLATFVLTIERLISFRIGEFVVKYLTDALVAERQERGAATVALGYAVEVLTTLLAFAVAWLLAPAAARWFIKSPSAAEAFRLYSWIFVANLGLSVSVGVLHAFGAFRTLSFLDAGRAVATLGALAILAARNGTLTQVLVAILATSALYTITVHAVALRRLANRLRSVVWTRGWAAMRAEWRAVSSFLLSTNFSATASLIAKESEALWLAYFRTPTEVAFYKLAYGLAHMPMLPIKAMTQPTYRELALKLATGDSVAARALLRRASITAASWVIPVGILVAVFSSWLIRTLYTSEMLPAVPALLILLVGVSFSQVLYWNRPVLLALHETSFLLKMSVAMVVLKLALLFALVPAFGYIGNALVLTLLYLIGITLSVRHAERRLARLPRPSRAA